jgi:hypothetical protein
MYWQHSVVSQKNWQHFVGLPDFFATFSPRLISQDVDPFRFFSATLSPAVYTFPRISRSWGPSQRERIEFSLAHRYAVGTIILPRLKRCAKASRITTLCSEVSSFIRGNVMAPMSTNRSWPYLICCLIGCWFVGLTHDMCIDSWHMDPNPTM